MVPPAACKGARAVGAAHHEKAQQGALLCWGKQSSGWQGGPRAGQGAEPTHGSRGAQRAWQAVPRGCARAERATHTQRQRPCACKNTQGRRRASRTRPAGANAARHAACAASAAAAGAAPRRARSQRRSAASSSGSPPVASWPAASGGSRARTARSSVDCECVWDAPAWRRGGRCAGAGQPCAGRPQRCWG